MTRNRASRPAAASAWTRTLALTALAVTLGGCGMKSLKSPMRIFGEPSRGNAPAPVDPVREAEAQAALAPKEPYWPFRLAELHLAADSTAQAESALRAALERDPGYAPALSLFSKLCFDSKRHAEAVAALETARSNAARFPDGFPPALLAGLALHYDALDRLDQSRAVMAAVPPSARDDAGSALVYLTLRGDAPDSAAGLAAEALREHPKSAASRNNFGITRLRAGDPTAARKAFLEAIDIDPALAGPYYNLAILEKFYRLDDAAAARWFRLYRERATEDPDGLAGTLAPANPELAEKKEEP